MNNYQTKWKSKPTKNVIVKHFRNPRKWIKQKYKFYYHNTLPFPLRNALESVREELKQKGDEVKCKLDKSEENVCYVKYKL